MPSLDVRTGEVMRNDLRLIYENRFGASADYRDRVWKILCRDFFQRYVPEDARILDVGAGWGEFINNVVAGQRMAMDMNPAVAERLESGVAFIQQDCCEPWALESESLDVVFSSNFFEHLASKSALESTVSEACRCLKPGGTIMCLGPNIRYVGDRYWDFWDHHIPISDSSLAELLSLAGFTICEQIPRFLPFSMSTGFQPPPLLVALYLRFPVIWRIFGKQFLLVASR
jgi:SAM-dependent methyltransferase